MNPDDFEARMRLGEYYHTIKVFPWAWTVIRLDGRSFSKFTERMNKPFDVDFHDAMASVAQTVFKDFNGLYAYTESDEISILLPKNMDLFDREVEKLVSVSAALAASALTTYYKGEYPPCAFDSRIWIGPAEQDVVDYFRWRAADANRCALNSYSYWTLRKKGLSASRASKELEEKGVEFKNQLLLENGVTYNDVPGWQRRGTGFYWEEYKKEGFNPLTKETVPCDRRRIKTDENLPAGEDYDKLLLKVIHGDS